MKSDMKKIEISIILFKIDWGFMQKTNQYVSTGSRKVYRI